MGLVLKRCSGCKAYRPQEEVSRVTILTKYRKIVVKTFRCLGCLHINTETNEEENPNVEIWD